MTGRSVERDLPPWLSTRLDGVPSTVGFLVEATAGTLGDRARLAQAARRARDRALAGEGEHRGAFHLLAADGLATLAALAAVLEPDADDALARVVDDLIR